MNEQKKKSEFIETVTRESQLEQLKKKISERTSHELFMIHHDGHELANYARFAQKQLASAEALKKEISKNYILKKKQKHHYKKAVQKTLIIETLLKRLSLKK